MFGCPFECVEAAPEIVARCCILATIHFKHCAIQLRPCMDQVRRHSVVAGTCAPSPVLRVFVTLSREI